MSPNVRDSLLNQRYLRVFLRANHSRKSPSTIPETFRPSSIAAIFAALIRSSSRISRGILSKEQQ
jgi:hypothetical protein